MSRGVSFYAIIDLVRLSQREHRAYWRLVLQETLREEADWIRKLKSGRTVKTGA